MKSLAIIFLLTVFCLPNALSSDIEFHEINENIGLCPITKTVKAVPENASYVAVVCNPDKFSKVLKNTQKGDKVYMYNLGNDKWHIMANDQTVRVSLEWFRFNHQRQNDDFIQVTKICTGCTP